MKLLLNSITIAIAFVAGPALSESWTLDGGASKLAYGSIKKDTVGEVNSFESLSGQVAPDGSATIDIDLSSVETNIDIRNERMIEHVFRKAGTARLTAQFDMDEISGLAVGDSLIADAETVLSLAGTEVELDAEMFVARLSETRVLVTTNDMVFLSTEDAGVNAGVDTLMELAGLPGITRTVPITARFLFTRDSSQAAAPAAAPAETTLAAVDGDPKAGKKVFRKCKACHEVKEGKNGVGPSLHGIFGTTAGQVDGFRYSSAMTGSGIVWTAETLSAFVADPKAAIPGNKMQFRGLKKQDDIDDLMAYLVEETQG